MNNFEYLEPKTISEANSLLFEYGDAAKILAGGVDLIPRMKKGKIKTDCVVNIQAIGGLDYIAISDEKSLEFGAMATLHNLETLDALRQSHPILHEAIHQITSVQSKTMGTAVGNLCVGTPGSDVATALMALDGEIKIAGPDGERSEPVDSFYLGYLKTSLKPGEMVTGVKVPAIAPDTGTAFLNLVRTHADIAKLIVSVAVCVSNGVCRDTRISLGAAAPIVFRAKTAENILRDARLTPATIAAAAEKAAAETVPITDLRSNADYRKKMAGVLVARAIEKAVATVGDR